MPRRKIFERGEFYHCFGRGLDRQNLFFHEDDYKHFRSLIDKRKKRYKLIRFFEYSLLPNHFHFVFQSRTR